MYSRLDAAQALNNSALRRRRRSGTMVINGKPGSIDDGERGKISISQLIGPNRSLPISRQLLQRALVSMIIFRSVVEE